MGDVGDAFKDWRQSGQKKREQNRKSSADMLKDAGILYELKNQGAHLIVHDSDQVIDFWPGTGKWIPRKTKFHGRGVRNLINYINGV